MPATQTTGELRKLSFTAYKDIGFSERNSNVEEFFVMFNPSSVSVKLQVDREEQQGNGSTSSEMRFKAIKPQDYQFEFILDGTGAVTAAKKDIPVEVEKFLKVVYSYDGTEHKPNYVMIRYGAVLLKAVLKTVDITYTLFKPDGTPLRAKITVVFTSCVEQNLSEMINNRQSPDLTHLRKITQDQKLVSMAYNIYKSNNYYVEVAKANKLNSFRSLPEGTEVYFPPIEKKKKS